MCAVVSHKVHLHAAATTYGGRSMCIRAAFPEVLAVDRQKRKTVLEAS